MKRALNGTVQQRVFDALMAHDGEGLTLTELSMITGLTRTSINTALTELRNQHHCPIQTCRQPSRYRIPPGTTRPADGRGRKP